MKDVSACPTDVDELRVGGSPARRQARGDHAPVVVPLPFNGSPARTMYLHKRVRQVEDM